MTQLAGNAGRPGFMPSSQLAWIVVVSVAVGPAAAETNVRQVTQDFSQDPGWEGKKNLPDPSACLTKVQAFGFSPTRHADGQTGEIGGRVSRSQRPATYAKKIPVRTLNQRLRASGRLSVTHSEGGSGVLVGWFNSTSRGWRTPNSLVFRIDGEAGKFRVFFEYGTQTWKTGGGTTFEGRYQTTKTPLLLADGKPHAWSLAYDPAGAGGAGEIAFTLDGKVYRAALERGHKQEGAIFDRFGIMNVQISGSDITPWLDDLVIDGVREDFSTDPGWEGRGNRVRFADAVIRPNHNFGHRNTSHAGGKPGEVGGVVWRIESTRPQNAGYYGAPIGSLSLDQELVARGRVCLRAASSDSGVLLGWFNSLTSIGAPPANFVGIFIEGPSRIGHYVRPAYGTSNDIKDLMATGPIIRPDGKPHEWTFRYSPNANEGRGRITMSLDGESVSMDLKAGARGGNAAFDRFGLVSWHRGGHFVEIYFDDISYSAHGSKRQK